MKNSFFLLSVLTLLVTIGCGQSQDIPLSQRYPGPWHVTFDKEITMALGKNNIGGCGDYKYRESSRDKGEYIVLCSRDGSNWTGYLVWPHIGSVIGPLARDQIPN